MKTFYLLLCTLFPICSMGQEPVGKSQWIYPDTSGKLVYKTTPKGDRIIDFSHAGYKGGGVTLPEIAVKVTISPLGGEIDCTELIQNAINQVSALPKDANGFRGAVLLQSGRYVCDRPLQIAEDGVVLRGSGSCDNGSTIYMTGSKHTAIILNNGIRQRAGNRLGTAESSENPIKITDKYIPAGSYTFTIANATGLSVGDNIEIRKPVTAKWIKYLEMDNLVRDGKPQTWIKTGSLLITERTIASIKDNKITLTVPLVDSYDAEFTDNNTTLVVANDIKRVKQSGIENLRIQSPEQAVNHSQALYYAIGINGEDCWVKDVNALETMESVRIGGRRITLQQVNVIRKALHQGASKPAEFAPNGGQILLDRCSVSGDNIWYVALGAGQTGPIVFLNCTFTGSGHIEGHQRWSTGMLLDNCKLPGGGVDFKNRGEMGSGHGWGTAWSVAWNCEAATYVNQIPSGTYNWVIGCKGENTPLRRPFKREGPTLPVGIFDSHEISVKPSSLYLAQLKERLGKDALSAIGYDDYVLQGNMQADKQLTGKDFKAIHQYMQQFGWDYSEHPNSSDKDHKDGVHCEVIYDNVLKQYVFKFTNHANTNILDGDRGKIIDRQRNEMKTQTSST